MFFHHVGWNKLLEDNGVKGRWMSYLELVNGTLGARGVKVLILPRALALGTAERNAVERWVEAGGTVIADSLTGMYDDKLRRRSIAAGGGWWDSFLGITRADYSYVEVDGAVGSAWDGTAAVTPGVPPEFEPIVAGLTSDGLRAVEPGIRAGTGMPLLHFDGNAQQPALLARKHGAGTVVYMNLGVATYGYSPPDGSSHQRRRKEQKNTEATLQSSHTAASAPVGGQGAPYVNERQNPSSASATNLRRLVANLLRVGGVTPKVRITQGHTAASGASDGPDVYNFEKTVHVLPGYVGGWVIGCVVNSYMDGPSDDWGARNDTAALLFGQPGATTAQATIHLPEPVFLYNTRQGGLVSNGGSATKFDVLLPVYEGSVFTALPYNVTAVTIAAQQQAPPLPRVTIAVAVQAPGMPELTTHVLLLTVANAAGAAVPLLTQKLVASSGAWTGVVPFGLDDQLTGVTITCVDVATGMEGAVVLK